MLIPTDQKNAWLFGFSVFRIISLIVMLAGLVFSIIAARLSRSQSDIAIQVISHLERILALRFVSTTIFIGSLIGVILGTVAILNFWNILSKYDAILLRAAPVIVFAYILCIQVLMLIWPRASSIWTEITPFDNWRILITDWLSKLPIDILWIKKLMVMIVFVILGAVYFNLTNSHATLVNRRIASDQGANLLFTRRVVQSGFRYTGKRNQMPVYPYLLTVIYKPGLGLEELFEPGKRFNIILSLILLGLLLIITRRFLSFLGAFTLTLLTAFGLYIFKAGYVQVEILYYFVSFLAYLFMSWMLISPSLKVGIATGIIVGLAHLSKASALPGFILFLGLFFMKETIAWLVNKRHSKDQDTAIRFHLIRYAIGLVVVAFFFGVIFQYISESKRKYGQYFYNVNSTFYVWYDTWAQAKKGTAAHGDREGWPKMEPGEIPSFQKYLSEHTAEDIIGRINQGMETQIQYLLDLYGKFDYLLILFVLLLILALIYYPVTGKLIREYFWPILFAMGYFVGYLILYAWFLPITDYDNQRMTYSLFLPIVSSAFITMEKLARDFNSLDNRKITIHPHSIVKLFYWILIILILLDLAGFIPQALLSNTYSK